MMSNDQRLKTGDLYVFDALNYVKKGNKNCAKEFYITARKLNDNDCEIDNITFINCLTPVVFIANKNYKLHFLYCEQIYYCPNTLYCRNRYGDQMISELRKVKKF